MAVELSLSDNGRKVVFSTAGTQGWSTGFVYLRSFDGGRPKWAIIAGRAMIPIADVTELKFAPNE